MWPDRRLTDLLEIEHPLVLAPMAGFGTVELAAAVCAAGGLGSIGCGPVPPPSAAKTIAELRALTNKPINVNFFCHAPAKADAGREAEQSEQQHQRAKAAVRQAAMRPQHPLVKHRSWGGAIQARAHPAKIGRAGLRAKPSRRVCAR